MARIRSLKPDMWQDEQLGTVAIEAQTLFVGLITQADDEGRLKGGATRMRALIWPYKTNLDAARVEEWLDELQSAGLVIRYEHDEKQYLALPGWHNQRIDHPSASDIPAPDPGLFENIRESSRALAPDRRGRDRNGKEGSSLRSDPVEPSSTIRELFGYWQQRCSHEGAKLTEGRRRKVTARLREGYSPDQIRVAIDGAAVAPFINDQGKRFDDLELICRTGEKLEDFIARGEQSVEDSPAALAKRMRERQAA